MPGVLDSIVKYSHREAADLVGSFRVVAVSFDLAVATSSLEDYLCLCLICNQYPVLKPPSCETVDIVGVFKLFRFSIG